MFKSISNSVKKIFGSKYERDVATMTPIVEEINEVYEQLSSLSHNELRNKTVEFRARIAEYLSEVDQEIDALHQEASEMEDLLQKEALFEDLDKMIADRDKHIEDVLQEILPEAFAVVKETARRFLNEDEIRVTATDHDRELATKKSYLSIDGDDAVYKTSWTAGGNTIDWNMIHYDVQLIGGMVLHEGKIAEMATGEGKTLVATLPAYLNGLTGLGVHVITVNNYLAQRDAEWVGPLFEFLLLTVDCIDKYKPHSKQRIAAYNCDITYGTNNEFGFDYLRDNMVKSADEKVQGKHHFAMIDEVDSVLIDEARTPLIISGPIAKGAEVEEYVALKPKIERLFAAQRKLATDFLAEAKKLIKEGSTGVKEGEGGMALLRAFRALPKYRPLIKYLSQDGIKVLLQKTENFYMQEQSKNMHIADEPLLFTIDEKNRNVDLTEKGAEFLSRGEEDPNLFVMPDIASAVNDIQEDPDLTEEEKEQQKAAVVQDFSIKSRRLHSVNQLLKAYTLFEKDQEYVVIDEQVKIVDEQTGRMMEGRRYSDGLHQALEAKENVKVGDITQTYATITLQNYFRMYHKLSGMTGTAETEASELWEIYKLDVVVIPTNRPIVRDDREDMVFKTSREKFNAVISEIVELSNSGRPVLVGTTSVEISELLSRMLKIRNINHNVLNAKQHQREADIVAEAGQPGAVTIATNMAGRGTDIKLGKGVKEAGGLAIIGTERHDSRRVDRQLRGRAGRQGDPGSSQFYVSLEDPLMRMFHSERIAKLMDRMGHKEGEVIQHSMVTKSIERAQRKLEENNFGIRKRLLEYDDVMNIQREAIYKKRDNALSGDRLSLDLNNMFLSFTENMVAHHKGMSHYDEFRETSMSLISLDPEMDANHFNDGNLNELIEQFQEKFFEFYRKKGEYIRSVLMPIIKRVQENEGHKYKRIAIPFTDGAYMLPISADLKTAINSSGDSIMSDIEKAVTLAILDEEWKEHLRAMDELKDSVQAASFEQKDPLVVYKMEAYRLFEQLIFSINEKATGYLSKGYLVFREDQSLEEAKQRKSDTSKLQTNKDAAGEAARAAGAAVSQGKSKPSTFKRESGKVGRNAPCPCGSGKKYKHCHGKK